MIIESITKLSNVRREYPWGLLCPLLFSCSTCMQHFSIIDGENASMIGNVRDNIKDKITVYIDDISLIIDNRNELDKDLVMIKDLLADVGLSINYSKSKIITNDIVVKDFLKKRNHCS